MMQSKSNRVVAITGGIGSGKSTALDIIKKLGYKSLNADEIYSELLQNEDFVKEVSSIMQIKPLTVNGRLVLDKRAITTLVFSNEEMLKKLNSVTHPKIMGKMMQEARSCKGLVFCEVPLLYEGSFENLFDFVFVIKREEDKRFNSVMQRDGKTLEQIKEIAKNQYDYAKISNDAHTFIIENDGDKNHLEKNLKVAIEKL